MRGTFRESSLLVVPSLVARGRILRGTFRDPEPERSRGALHEAEFCGVHSGLLDTLDGTPVLHEAEFCGVHSG